MRLMPRPALLERPRVDQWILSHPGWAREGDAAITKRFAFADFSAALAFVVRVGLAAEKHDHHPDLTLGWGYATARWSTHDAGGVTDLDLQLADICDGVASR